MATKKPKQRSLLESEQNAKWRAYWHVKNALDKGELVRPEVCDNCGKRSRKDEFGRKTIQAHHYKGYAEAHYMDIIWLCTACHHFAQIHGWTKLDGTRPGDPKKQDKPGAKERRREL